jgi:beta-fructofuranosidase
LVDVAMLRREDAWIWDSWYANDRGEQHAFFLTAPRALGDPDRRHHHAVVGHATSPDLSTWSAAPDALRPGSGPAFDDLATWTGCVLQHAGVWWMFYTGVSRASAGRVQSVGAATSTDLSVWTRASPTPVVEPDRRWYQRSDAPPRTEQAWRDPWVFRRGETFHMLITAHAADDRATQRGVLGHCTSTDLLNWTVLPPITGPGDGFGHLEVPQVEVVDGVSVLLFSCDTAALRAGCGRERGGVFSVVGDDLLGPFDLSTARRFPHESLYAGRLVHHDDAWWLLGFRDVEDGHFVGALSDPVAVTADPTTGVVPR